MCIVLLSRKKYRQMQDELSELHVRTYTAEEKEHTLNNIVTSDKETIAELHKRIETQQRIIDGLNAGTIKPRPTKLSTLTKRNEDHNPYPKE